MEGSLVPLNALQQVARARWFNEIFHKTGTIVLTGQICQLVSSLWETRPKDLLKFDCMWGINPLGFGFTFTNTESSDHANSS
ncbi:hypothetical protein Mal48_28640 [Thalassoglobus polymorphus]|uniref:Uncharacterized protein n=1 Tax=Thalassoglobus polymorphus TaxID=2527994 RepID=A0A517QPP5_9PLAN|nr:hypothetical protein Mal48_28640 [Thalassoglobus polymorphus]